MSDYICGNCKHYDSDICECSLHPEYEDMFEEDTCDGWTDDNEIELTEQEKDAIEGDIEMHRKFVED